MRALLLFVIFTVLPVSVVQAMTNDELTMTRNVAERGNPSAQVLLAIAYLHGDGGLTADPAEAARWFEKAALQGNSF
ncbi:MAG: SEL1-like repeat protein, partial [Azonexus sp.]